MFSNFTTSHPSKNPVAFKFLVGLVPPALDPYTMPMCMYARGAALHHRDWMPNRRYNIPCSDRLKNALTVLRYTEGGVFHWSIHVNGRSPESF